MVDAAVVDNLAARFAILQDERARTWLPDQLERNLAQRRALVAAFDPAAVVQVGDVLADVPLRSLDGGSISLDDLVGAGPAVLLFFRYAECPADNIALPFYARRLAPALDAAGVRLVAISPQRPERLRAIVERHALPFTIASDPGNRLARSLGLTFVPLDTPHPPPPGWVGEITGTDSWELPQTSVLILDHDRRVRFVAVSPDWLDRTEPETILAALDRLADEADTNRPKLRALAG